MRQGTFALSQKELQRVAVISSCVKGDLACARAASLLNLTPRHVKRLKCRLRQGGEAALAHASRGRPSHRRLPDRVRECILQLARTTYAGFNDHHLCEKLVEKEGLSLGRETPLPAALGRDRLAPETTRSHSSPAPSAASARRRDAALGRQPAPLVGRSRPAAYLLGFLDDATRRILVAEFFLTESARGYFRLLHRLAPLGVPPVSLRGSPQRLRSQRRSLVRRRTTRRLAVNPPSSVAPWINSASPYRGLQSPSQGWHRTPWGTFRIAFTSELRLAGAHDLGTSNQVLRHFLPDHNRRFGRAPRQAEKLASRSRKSGPHLLLSPPTQCRQRQRRPMERGTFPDPTPAATLQLRWGWCNWWNLSGRKGLDLLRRYQTPPQRWINSNPRGDIFIGLLGDIFMWL